MLRSSLFLSATKKPSSVIMSFEKWFDDEDNVSKSLGLLEEPVLRPSGNELRCWICLENYLRDKMSAPACLWSSVLLYVLASMHKNYRRKWLGVFKAGLSSSILWCCVVWLKT
ncbi:putative E3 ubiquitin-protein ligase ARI8 [Apium graveolens]|uniref:putative E3 ubiquitin-protein ligase ARI8 n=1 Tax=Apium graveolens TaxID=4045 RepID=UPI003D7B6C88